MSSIVLNRRINKFLEGKQREMPELRKEVDELFDDLVREGRSGRTF